MNSEFRIMRIGGIDIKIGWPLLIIGSFISLSLATGYFPALLPDWSAFTYLIAALLCFIGLYASVLLHELVHAFVAKKQGLEVKSIVLSAFGSAASLPEVSSKPRAEFWLAMAGPLTHLGLAGVFFGIINLPGLNPVITAIAFYLMGVNFLLGVFNLLPAYPLDGGRVLEALVWGRTKNRPKANRVVTTVGRSFGWGFTGLGLFLIVSGNFFEGMWLVLLGWFLTNSARLSVTQTMSGYSLEGLKVGQVMWHADRVLSPQTPLEQAAQAFFGLEPGRVLPVVEQGYLMGTLSLEQLAKIPAPERAQVRVGKVMTVRGSLLALRPEDDLQASEKTLKAKPAAYAAVIGEGGQFAGLFYQRDIARFLEMQQLLAPNNLAKG